MSLPSPTSALLDRHVSFTGTVAGHDLIVLGSLDGDLRLTGRLHVAAGSRMRARVQASVVELEGDFEGELRAETLRVTASARARGVFAAERLSIEEGAVLEGDVQAPAAPGALVLAAAPGPAAAEATPASTAAVADETAGDEPSGAEPDPAPAATPA
jgi:cytoskeletal protein CcmA (bactofilin family)